MNPPPFLTVRKCAVITEGLTEIYTLMATSKNTSSSTYNRQIQWAVKLTKKIGPRTMVRAFFGNDVASMVQVEKAINQLVTADKRAPELLPTRFN